METLTQPAYRCQRCPWINVLDGHLVLLPFPVQVGLSCLRLRFARLKHELPICPRYACCVAVQWPLQRSFQVCKPSCCMRCGHQSCSSSFPFSDMTSRPELGLHAG